MNVLEQIKHNGIVAIIRGVKPEQIVAIAKALHGGGGENTRNYCGHSSRSISY